MTRIWHQSYTVLNDVPLYKSALRDHFEKVIGPDTTVESHGMAPNTYPGDYPLTHIRYLYLSSLHKEQFIRAALRAEAEGFDAFYIANIADTAFEEIRSLLRIPVIAYGQASLLFAATLGQPAAVVSFVADVVGPQLRRNAAQSGLGDMLGPVLQLSVPFDDLLKGYEDPAPVVALFTDVARKAIALGANVLIPGEGPLNVLLARAGVAEIDGVPVVDSFGVGLSFCEMRSRFYRTTGLTHSQSGFFYATPPPEVVEETRKRYFGGSQLPTSDEY